jgi:hypothetical protein
LIRKFSILVLTLFVVTAFSVSGYAANNLPLNDGEVYKIKLKEKCTGLDGKKVKVKPQKALHMRVFAQDEVGTPNTEGYQPAFAKVVFYTSTKKSGVSIVGWGELDADYNINYVVDDGIVGHRDCSDPEVACSDVAGNLVDGFAVLSVDRPAPEPLVAGPFDRKNSALKCYVELQGFVKTGKKKKRIKGWDISWCYDATTEVPDSNLLIPGGAGLSKCSSTWNAKQILK